jgi:TonB family protein
MDHTVEISILICLIFFAKLLAPKKLPPWWHYSLWLLLLVRMLVPVEFENRLNLFNFVPAVATPHVSEYILDAPPEVLNVPGPVMTEVPPVDTSTQFIVKKSIPVIWFSGAVILGVCILFESLSFWMSVRRKPVLKDKAILALLCQCKKRMGIKRKVDIIVTDSVRCPALFGYLRPRLLLPEGIFKKIGEKELSYAFMHELGHLKRHDIGVSWLITVLQVVHWCNPLVWLASYQMRIDQEAACDAVVLSHMKPKQSADYAKAIVGFLEKFCQNCQLPALAGVLENRTQMKKRIARIIQYRKASFRSSSVSFFMLAIAGCILFTLTGVAAEKDAPPIPQPVVEKSTADPFLFTAKNEPVDTLNPPDASWNGAADIFMNIATANNMDPGMEYADSLTSLAVFSEAGLTNEKFTQPRMVLGVGGGDAGQKDLEKENYPISSGHLAHNGPGNMLDTITEFEPPVGRNSVVSEKTVSEPAASVRVASVEIIEVTTVENVQTRATGLNGAMSPQQTQTQIAEAPVSDIKKSSADELVAMLNIQLDSTSVPKGNFGPAFPMTIAQSDIDYAPAPSGTIYSENESIEQNDLAVAAEIEMIKETGKVLLQNRSTRTSATALANHKKADGSVTFMSSDVDAPPKVIRSYPPRYPYLAKRDDITGSILLQFVITKEGNAVDTTVLESEPKGIFDESALRAIEQYRFKPGMKDGEAVDVKVNLPIRFDLT